jgi:predicted nucleic acid-binding Zn ribbon protein
MAALEVYQLECWACHEKVEVPAGSPDAPERIPCPRCGAVLQIEWRPEESAAAAGITA